MILALLARIIHRDHAAWSRCLDQLVTLMQSLQEPP